MDGFCEQVVKKKNGAKQKLVSALLISFFAVLELFSIFIYMMIPEPFWIFFTMIIACVAVLVLWLLLPRINRIEYDYSVVSNVLGIDKILNKSSRKKLLRLEIKNVIQLGVFGTDEIPNERYSRALDFSSGDKQNRYFCIYREAGRGKCLLVFSPNDKILSGMKPYLNREIVMRLFYGK